MSLELHRGRHVELLVDRLAEALVRDAPEDPFAPLPVIVGSSGMERWLRHELATRLGVASRLAFLLPSTGFARAAHARLGTSAADWSPAPPATGWSGMALAWRVLQALRRLAGRPELTAVAHYLAAGPGADSADAAESVDAAAPADATALALVGPRELAFAREVGAAVERLLHDRDFETLQWAHRPESSPEEHRWLALVLAELVRGAPADPPAALRQQLDARPAVAAAPALHLFGLSTLRPGDKRWVRSLSRHYTLHLYQLAPTSAFVGELRSGPELRRQLRRATGRGEADRLLDESAQDNLLLSTLGTPSRDLQGWLESLDGDGLVERDGDAAAVRERPIVSGDDAAPATSLLGALQQWIDAVGETPSTPDPDWQAALQAEEAATGADGCHSMELHLTHGALRQAEAVRDAVLRRMRADPSLEPRHVLVLTPDLATHGPLLSAVLARDPALPVQLRDTGLRGGNPVAEALLALLSLADARVTAESLVSLLELEPVQQRFGLAPAELPRLREELAAAHLRWGWDADDRQRHGQPADDASTISAGLERLALGVLMSVDDPLQVVTTGRAVAVDDRSTWRDETACGPEGSDRVAVNVGSAEAAARFGAFALFCQEVRALLEGCAQPLSAADWRRQLTQLLDRLTLVDGRALHWREQVDSALAEWLPVDAGAAMEDDSLGGCTATGVNSSSEGDAAGDGSGRPSTRLSLAAVRMLLSEAFDRPVRSAASPGGALQVAGLEPMRSLPFRVVVVVGLDDGAFPRASTWAAWDPMRVPKPGEYDRAEVDRHLFLETLLCAREALVLIGCGFEPARGAVIPAAAPLEEVRSLLRRGLGPDLARRLERLHPLQPWSQAGLADARLAPADPGWWAAARRRAAASGDELRSAGLSASDLAAPWPLDAAERSACEEGVPLTAQSLAAALARPQQELLGRRLGLALDRRRRALEDRESLDPDGLELHALRSRLLIAAQQDLPGSEMAGGSGRSPPRVGTRLRAEGALPPGGLGQLVLDEGLRALTPLDRYLSSLGVAVDGAPPIVRCMVDGHLRSISASPEHRRRRVVDGAVQESWLWLVAGKSPGDLPLMRAFLSGLVAVAGQDVDSTDVSSTERGHPPQQLLCLGHAEGRRFHLPSPAEARSILGDLSSLRRELRAGPVLLLPRYSRLLAESLLEGEPVEKAHQQAARDWESAGQFGGAPAMVDDPWVGPLFGHWSTDDLAAHLPQLCELALRCWGPLLRCSEKVEVSP